MLLDDLACRAGGKGVAAARQIGAGNGLCDGPGNRRRSGQI